MQIFGWLSRTIVECFTIRIESISLGMWSNLQLQRKSLNHKINLNFIEIQRTDYISIQYFIGERAYFTSYMQKLCTIPTSLLNYTIKKMKFKNSNFK